MNPTPTDPREGKPPFVMPLIHGLNCEKVCHERANGYLHAPDDDGPYDVDGLKYCGRCHTWLPETPEQLQSTNSKLAAEIAELKEEDAKKLTYIRELELKEYRLSEQLAASGADFATLRAELEAVNTRYSELAAKRAKTDQLYQLALNNQEDLGKRLDEALNKLWEEKQRASAAESAAYDRGRSHELTEGNWLEVEKERNQLHEELEVQIEATRAAGAVCQRLERQRDTAIAAKDAAEKERDEAREVLRQIATLDCGCVPCTGQCRTGRAAEIELESRMELARAALTPAPTQEAPAGGVTISNETVGIIPTATTPTEASPDVSALGVEAASHQFTSPADVPSVGRGECPVCGSPEIEADTPRTVYACGSSDYDQRPNTFKQSEVCKPIGGRGELLPFDVADVLSGKAARTRDGQKVQFKAVKFGAFRPIEGMVGGHAFQWHANGRRTNLYEGPLDLFMLPTEGSGA